MKKLLIFHPALAPYRVDQFNALSKLFDLEVVFIFDNVWNHKFDQGILTSQLEFKFSYLLRGIRYKGRVFRFGMLSKIKKFNPDIVLGYEYSFSTQYLILLKRLGIINQKIGSTIDDSLEICRNVQSLVRSFARKQTIIHLDYIIVFSDEVSEFYQSKFNLNKSQIVVSPIIQDSNRLRKNKKVLEEIAEKYLLNYSLKNKKVLLFVGRFIPEKGISNFIINISPRLVEHDNYIIILVGDGQDSQFIRNLIAANQLETKVLMPGRFEGDELFAWYLCASGFVLPSTYEPFGAVVNEALIFGLKVLCSQFAGASGLIKENGLLFNPFDKRETESKFVDFMSSLQHISNLDLIDRPSLMSLKNDYFINEWGKLL